MGYNTNNQKRRKNGKQKDSKMGMGDSRLRVFIYGLNRDQLVAHPLIGDSDIIIYWICPKKRD